MDSIFHWDIVQGTDEWIEVRAGKITGSVAKTFLVDGKSEGGFGAGAITEMYKMMEERLTGVPREHFGGNKATDWGHTYEPEAAEYYENKHFIKLKSIGFVEKNKDQGASPDRLIPSQKKGIEIKCFPIEHIKIADTKKYGKSEYIQCQYNLWCTGYKSWDLIYYHPNMPTKIKMIEFTFYPDKVMFSQFDERCLMFKRILDARVKKNSD